MMAMNKCVDCGVEIIEGHQCLSCEFKDKELIKGWRT
jgi:ribosomal protein L32